MSNAPAADAAVLSALRVALERHVGRRARVVVEHPAVGRHLKAAGFRVVEPGGPTSPGTREGEDLADAIVLAAQEFSEAGEGAEPMLAETVARVRPGGHVIATVLNAVPRDATEQRGGRKAWRPSELTRFFGGLGLVVEALWAPGAHAIVTGRAPRFDAECDAEPSLLGAGPVLLAVARTPASTIERSDVFFATLPAKVIAASTLTRADDGRVLIIHDSFKQHWSIPGGVVDQDEDPLAAAVRETREETGIDVVVTGLMGVFHGLGPDRLVFLFSAEPVYGMADVDPQPVHTHEVDAARWVPLDEALRRVAPYTAAQVRRSLAAPGRVWGAGPEFSGIP